MKIEQRPVIHITVEEYAILDNACEIAEDLSQLAYHTGDKALQELAWEVSNKLDDLTTMIYGKCKIVD